MTINLLTNKYNTWLKLSSNSKQSSDKFLTLTNLPDKYYESHYIRLAWQEKINKTGPVSIRIIFRIISNVLFQKIFIPPLWIVFWFAPPPPLHLTSHLAFHIPPTPSEFPMTSKGMGMDIS